MIFHPLSLLHVIITDILYTRWREIIQIWKTKKHIDDCKIYYLHLKMLDTKDNIRKFKKMVKTISHVNNKKICRIVNTLSDLYKELIIINKKNTYYKSIYNIN